MAIDIDTFSQVVSSHATCMMLCIMPHCVINIFSDLDFIVIIVTYLSNDYLFVKCYITVREIYITEDAKQL